MLKGRKVTDPVVQGAAAGGYDSKPGLSKAWDTVGKAKSELRKIEQRLEEADRQPLAPQLNQTGETSITDYGGLNWNRIDNETFNVPDEFASGAVVDNYGRSAYLRSKTHTARKVSRLDGKYIEERDDREKQVKPAPKSHANHAGQSSKPRQTNFQLQEKKYSSDRQKPSRQVKDKHVEFVETVGIRENNVNYGVNRNRQLEPEEQSTLTNSRDIRDTEIRFLNNNLTQDIELEENGPRLTLVSVTVPGATRASSASSGYSTAGTQRQGPTSRSHFLDLVPDNQEMDGRTSECSSISDSESGRRRRIKGDIRKIDPDGLAKIRETIQNQRKSKDYNEDVMGTAEDDLVEPAGPGHYLHEASEPIVPRSQDLIEGAEKTAKVRKVVAGLGAPSYKGFSETEVRYRIVENKMPKSQDASRKDKKRQVSLKLQQDKRSDPVGTWLNVEDGDGKSKKVTRVIAPSRRPTKQQPQTKNKEIITTSSWRAGQELILRELGPVKSKKSYRSRDRDTNSDTGRDGMVSPMDDRPEALGGEDYLSMGATAAELQHHKNLSEEARRVYNDLQLDDDHEEGKKRYSDKKHKATTKRKAPKVTEFEKQQASMAKQRHYDQEQIRRYMQKQKAERLKQQKEAELKMKEEEEARRRQLEELYNKQKKVSVASAAVGRKERTKLQQNYESMPTMSVGELPRHHPFHTERTRFMVSSDSENKENHHSDEDMDISDSSSTITGDGSMEDHTPTGTPRRTKINIELPSNKQSVLNKAGKQKTASKPPLENSSNIKTIGDFSFNVDGVMSKFSQALHEKLNEEPRSLDARGAYGGSSHQDNFRSLPADLNQNDGSGLSRADRIQAIKETAATLQSRLKQEAMKIQAQASNIKPAENGATSRPNVRWQDREPAADREDAFLTRYERVTGANEDYAVFKSNLPGTQAWPEQDSRMPAGAASAAKAPSSSGSKNDDIGEDTTITETSTFSEITLTDESDNEDFMDNKIGTGLQDKDFHAGSKMTDKPAGLNIPRPAHNPPKVGNSWDDPIPDDNNVFSIYSRRQQERVVRPGREPMFQRKPTSQVEEEAQIRATQASATQAPRAASAGAPRSRSPGLSQRGEGLVSRRVESPVGQRSESLRTQSPVDKSRSRQVTISARSAMEKADSEEDTVEEDVSYTQTFETEEKSILKSKTVSEKFPQSHRSLPGAGKSASKASERLSLQPEDSSMDEDMSQDEVTPRAERLPSDVDPGGPSRLSPNSLERRFYTEFHNLESMEMSLKQLTGVERTRAVAMAQQETVSLAQMLKARQQGYDLQMKDIQIKAKIEATEATKQLEDARKRASEAAINAADMIAKVRGEGVSAIQDSTRKLIDTQTEAAKATAEAAKFLSEARALGMQDTNRLAVETASAAAASAVNTAIEKKWQKTYPKTSSAKRRSDEARDQDDLESVGSVDDYSIAFDDSMTEDEREEKSFRMILPSESHRKKGKHIHSDNESVTSEGSTKTMDSDFQSLFKGQESFDKFTDEMVRKFMKEEEMRSQHQTSLLKLREEALIEKTKAELQWLEQQKKRIRNKGADDSFPQIVKRQRGLKMKLQEQQAEIKRLRDANKQAAKERKRQLVEEISKRKASQKGQQPPQPTGRLGRHHEVHTEAEVSSIDEASDVEKQRKDYKSDSEIYTEPGGRKSKTESRNLEKYKKINLDEKYLTQRQSKLMDRRKNAEELLKWKKLLDQEENRVWQLEKKALKVWDKKEKKSTTAEARESRDQNEPSVVKDESEAKISSKLSISKKENGTTKDSTIRTAASTAQDTTVISENISTARDESMYTSIKESIQSAVPSSESSPDEIHRRRMNDKSNLKAQNRSGSESSEIQSVSSMEDSKKQNDSSDDTMTHSYGNETFEETVTGSATKKTSKSLPSPKSPLDKLKKALPSPRNSPRSLFSPRSHARNSESESEESISLTESQSELSDFEGRIRALNEELRRRKTEADRLKRERKKKRKELMKNKEETLKKQIEAYDNQISQLKVELHKEMSNEPVKTTVRPQIKHPKVSPPKAIKKTEVTPTKQIVETDSSGPDSLQVSPEIQQDKDLKQTPPKSLATPPPAKISLDKISEASESYTGSRSDRSEPTYKEKLDKAASLKASSAEDDRTEEEIAEEISVATEASEDRSQEIKIDLNTKEKEDIYDVSVYTDDTFEHYTESVTHRLPLSARSYTQISEAESKNIPLSAQSESEEISEQISAALPSVSASESFIKPLDLKTVEPELPGIDLSEKSEKEVESDLEISPRSVIESSRPSSGERSIPESSESERLPVEKTGRQEKEDLVAQEINEPAWLKKPTGLISSAMADIDDLLGMPDDDEEEDETPVQSPRETPRDIDETQDVLGERQEGDGEAQNIHDILSDFDYGDRVSVTGLDGDRCTGTLLFKGQVEFAPGVWAGVELDSDNGRHNGMEDGERYFTCRDNHGLLVPADDLMAAPEEQEPMFFDAKADVRTSIESVSSINSENDELMRAISESDKMVQQFMEESPVSTPRNEEPDAKTRKERLADRITEDLFQSVLKENVNTISNIASKQEQRRKGPPPVAPKPKRNHDERPVQNGDLDELEAFLQPERTPPTAVAQNERNIEDNARVTANNLMNDAIDHMLSIRHNRQNQDKDHSRDSGNFTDGVEDDHHEVAVSPTEELQDVLDKQDEELQMDTPPRPGSPIPGLKSSAGGHKPVEDSGNFEGEFEEDLPWGTPSKSPPPYPGGEHDIRTDLSRPDMKKMTEELFYAVPHQTEEINGIVSSAVDEYWTQRRYGEPLDGLQPSDSYFTQEESGSDLISNSKRVFKKLIFELTGEVIRNIYKEEDCDPPVAWHKPKRKQCKFYRGASPPTTVDVLKPVVQQAIMDILGLNGARKANEKNKWGVRKKKDLVDTILVQELREEEPEWVNYDDDELAVKMQLTETIFENLLTDTVQTINRIYRKKQGFLQREASK